MTGTPIVARKQRAVLSALAIFCATGPVAVACSSSHEALPLPRLAADAVYLGFTSWSGDVPPGARYLPHAGDARLVGPSLGVRLVEAWTARQLAPAPTDSPQADSLPAAVRMPAGGGSPAPGHEFLLATIRSGTGAYSWSSAPDSKAWLSLRVAGIGRALPDDVASGSLRGELFLAVSVPTDKPVELVLAEGGREQSLDLRTGKRGPGEIAEFYRPALAGARVAARWPVTLSVKQDSLGASVCAGEAGSGWFCAAHGRHRSGPHTAGVRRGDESLAVSPSLHVAARSSPASTTSRGCWREPRTPWAALAELLLAQVRGEPVPKQSTIPFSIVDAGLETPKTL